MSPVTDWFPAAVKPVRRGVYERSMPDRSRWSYWNGRRWSLSFSSAATAFKARACSSSYQNVPWRGLAEKPQ